MPAEIGADLFVFSVSVAILSFILLVLQHAKGEKGESNGAIAALFPAIERLQEKLRIIEGKIDDIKQDTEALLEGQKRLERLMMDAAGGGAPAVQAVAEIRDLLRPGKPEIDEIPAEKLPNLVMKIIEDLQKPSVRPEDFRGTVKRALTEAQAQAADLKFADAAQLLDSALAKTESEDKDRALGRAALLAERARVARLQLNYRQAAAFYAMAADVMAFDPAAAWKHMLDATPPTRSTPRATSLAITRHLRMRFGYTVPPWIWRPPRVRRSIGP